MKLEEPNSILLSISSLTLRELIQQHHAQDLTEITEKQQKQQQSNRQEINFYIIYFFSTSSKEISSQMLAFYWKSTEELENAQERSSSDLKHTDEMEAKPKSIHSASTL